MCAAHRRSGAAAGGGAEAVAPVAPPSSLPRAPGWRDRLRLARARRRGVEVGAGVVVGRGVAFDVAPEGRVVLGAGAALGDGCRLHVARGAVVTIGAETRLGDRRAITAHAGVTIGARCLLADEVVLIDAEPDVADVERPVREQGLAAVPIAIGDGVRIGPGAAVLAGATIAAGAHVAAHALVTPDAAKAAAAAGAPPPGGPTPPRRAR